MGNKPSKRYNCDPCDYHVQKTSIWNRHLKSRKHQNKIKVLNPVVLINNCIECNIEFSYYSENKKCWTCKIKYIIFLEYKECDKKRGNFCKKDDCLFCFNRSFVSCDKHKYLDPADEIDPRQIEKHAHKIGHFNCIKCFHKFKLEIRYASMDHWCQYCNKKICKNIVKFLIFRIHCQHQINTIQWRNSLLKTLKQIIFNQFKTKKNRKNN